MIACVKLFGAEVGVCVPFTGPLGWKPNLA
jgi:hypothetical protein